MRLGYDTASGSWDRWAGVWNGGSGGGSRGRFVAEFGWMLRQLAGGSVLTELVGKALMMAKNVSPEVSLRPRKERLGGPVFYIRCCNTDSYRKHMEARYRLQVQSVK